MSYFLYSGGDRYICEVSVSGAFITCLAGTVALMGSIVARDARQASVQASEGNGFVLLL